LPRPQSARRRRIMQSPEAGPRRRFQVVSVVVRRNGWWTNAECLPIRPAQEPRLHGNVTRQNKHHPVNLPTWLDRTRRFVARPPAAARLLSPPPSERPLSTHRENRRSGHRPIVLGRAHQQLPGRYGAALRSALGGPLMTRALRPRARRCATRCRGCPARPARERRPGSWPPPSPPPHPPPPPPSPPRAVGRATLHLGQKDQKRCGRSPLASVISDARGAAESR